MSRDRSAIRSKELKHLLTRDHTLYGGALLGLDGYQIEIQARAVEVFSSPKPWRSAVTITGMARGAIGEALDRITGAFSKYGYEEPEVKIIINLAPADLLKEGTLIDLPLAIIMLQAAGELPDLHEKFEAEYILMGELGLHGEVRRVPGVLSMAYTSKPGQTLMVPAGNEKECAIIMAAPGHEGCKIAPVSTIGEVADFFRGKGKLSNALKGGIKFEPYIPKSVDFGRIKGQKNAKEAAIVAAAGGHNLLLIGPPGEGKSLLAGAIAGILPKLARDEVVELTRIYSACGELPSDGQIVTRRPMRSVHHTASKQALIGGGSKIPKPGEITLAHLGILFLDELAEFSASTLNSLRQPMENGKVSISRVGATLEYPSRFTLIAAMNPCPCGYYGTDSCNCSEANVRKYQGKISGPILDRIDLQVQLGQLSTEERFADTVEGESARIRANVEKARSRQRQRFRDKDIPHNAAIPGGHVREYCAFSEEGFEHFKEMIDSASLSTRSMDRLAKVSRTIADLRESDNVHPEHVDKAASFVVGGVLRDLFA